MGASHTSNDPFTRDQGRDLLSRAQALEGAAITCKHKLVPKDIGLENPSWVKIREDKEKEEQSKKEQNIKERDEDLALQQQSEPLDVIDPDG